MRAYTDRTAGVRLVTDALAPAPLRDAIEASLIAALEPDRDGVRCLLSRLTAGLGVQALVRGDDCYITITLNGATETFPVPAARLLDAFDHPYAYGATLPL